MMSDRCLDGAPLSTGPNPRQMRTATLAGKLADASIDVTWWASRFHYTLKPSPNGLHRAIEMRRAVGYVSCNGPRTRRTSHQTQAALPQLGRAGTVFESVDCARDIILESRRDVLTVNGTAS
jgi:hypothetical protein